MPFQAKQFLYAALLVALLLSAARAEISIVDDRGVKITLSHPPRRIVSLYGALTETVAALGRCENIVGVTAHENYPPCILEKPKVGTHLRPNLEIILSLRPDLILQGSVSRGGLFAVQQLEAQGLKVAVFNPYTIEMVFSTIERVGTLLAAQEEAARLLSTLRERLRLLEKKVSQVSSRPRVFYEVSYPSLLAAGQRHIVNDLIEKAGGVNVVQIPKKLARVSPEMIIKWAPEVYIIQKGPMNKNPTPPEKRPYFKILPAVQAGRVYYVDEFLFARPGPRVIEALEEMFRILHPEQP
ncbi:MAG: ABC transporter substrate-binding protein [Thermodesulfobacteria bacterium]|nr:ABC transporter substrate-binding protein [Thermodesulfobacteriota bacterium]